MQKHHVTFPRGRSLARFIAVGVVVLLSSTTMLKAEEQPASSMNQTEIAKEILAAFDAIFAGPHSGIRAVHGQGILGEGIFTPESNAKTLSRAPHFQDTAVPVVVRFSNFTSIPARVDGDVHGSPRGMAVKFILPDNEDTDIVAHSYNGFPVSTPEDFLGFLKGIGAKDSKVLDNFLEKHAAAKAFMDASKPAPLSYATEAFYGVDAFRFINAAGIERYGRYRIEPVAGQAHLSASEAAKRSPDYLIQDFAERLKVAPIEFQLLVQLPAPNDPILDGSIAWAEDRPVLKIGTITIRSLAAASNGSSQTHFFTPLNLVSGIASSGDPLLVARTRAYRMSFERRSRSAVARD